MFEVFITSQNFLASNEELQKYLFDLNIRKSQASLQQLDYSHPESVVLRV